MKSISIQFLLFGILSVNINVVSGATVYIPCDGTVHRVKDEVKMEDTFIRLIISSGSQITCFINVEAYEPTSKMRLQFFSTNQLLNVNVKFYEGNDNSTTHKVAISTITSGSSQRVFILSNSTFIQVTGSTNADDNGIFIRYFSGTSSASTCNSSVVIPVQAAESTGVLASPKFPESIRGPGLDATNCSWNIQGEAGSTVRLVIVLRELGRCNEYAFTINGEDYCDKSFEVITLQNNSFNIVMGIGIKEGRLFMLIYTLVPGPTSTTQEDSTTEITTEQTSESPTTAVTAKTIPPADTTTDSVPIVLAVLVSAEMLIAFIVLLYCWQCRTTKKPNRRGGRDRETEMEYYYGGDYNYHQSPGYHRNNMHY